MRPIIFRKLIVSPIVRYFLRVGYDISCSGERDTCYARIIGGPFQQLLADIFLRRARFLNASEMGARNEKREKRISSSRLRREPHTSKINPFFFPPLPDFYH